MVARFGFAAGDIELPASLANGAGSKRRRLELIVLVCEGVQLDVELRAAVQGDHAAGNESKMRRKDAA